MHHLLRELLLVAASLRAGAEASPCQRQQQLGLQLFCRKTWGRIHCCINQTARLLLLLLVVVEVGL
jgi:hypothetical protein